jgi:hypothetical protein
MARQPSPTAEFNTLAHFNNNTGALGRGVARHPFRYFIARGETLARIEGAIQDAMLYQSRLNDIAAEYGADKIEYSSFFFANPATIKAAPVIMRALKERKFIVCPAAPGHFLPNPHEYGSPALHDKLDRLNIAMGDDAARLKKELCRETDANDIVDGHFVFNDADNAEDIAFTAPPRLCANPLFIMPDKHSIGFIPDPSTPAGLALARRVAALHEQKNPLQRVMKWLGAWEVNTDPHGHPRFKDSPSRPNEKTSGRCEKIDDEWIVAVPVIGAGSYGADGKGGMLSGYQEEIAVPPGAVPLSIADYFARLERADMLSFAGPRAVPAPK